MEEKINSIYIAYKKCNILLQIMKISSLLFFLATFTVIAENTYSQQAEVSISFHNLTIRDALSQIEKSSDYVFLITKDAGKELDKRVTVEVESKSINEVLNVILKGTDLGYRVVERQVSIYRNDIRSSSITQQVLRIRGKVVDTDKEPLPGVTILLKNNTTVGVTTDTDGTFDLFIPNPPEKVVLRFSFVGMETLEKAYENKYMEVTMRESESFLEDVVITGYQRLDSRSHTSAIQTLMVEDILAPGVTSLDMALEGRVPEMAFMLNSGEVGSTPRLRIRGTSSLIGNREPLWVLDGWILDDPVKVSNEDLNNPDYINIIGNAIQGINPQDIERIDILKDASATALYGTRAANGVIVVTTKKGSVGRARFTYNHTSKVIRRPRYTDRNINLMNSKERVAFGKDLTDLHYAFPGTTAMVGYEGAYMRHIAQLTSLQDFQDEVSWYETMNTDWFKLLTSDTHSHDHTLGMSGGSEDVRYYSSLGYNRENGVTNTTYTNRMTARVNLNANIGEKIQLSFSLSGNVSDKNHLPGDINAMDYAYNTTRALPAYDKDGSYFYFHPLNSTLYGTGRGGNSFRYNILNEIDNSHDQYNSGGLNSYINFRYKPGKDLEFSVGGNYSRSATAQDVWWGEKTNYIARLKNAEYEAAPAEGEYGYAIVPYGGALNTTNSVSRSYGLRFQGDYRKPIGKKDMATATLGVEANSSVYESIRDNTIGYMKDRGMKYVKEVDMTKFPHYARRMAQENRTMSHNLSNSLSGYLSLSYLFGQIATLNANGRFDVSNKFGSRSNERLLPVWSVSGMLNIKDILFKESTLINDMRMRSSFGIQGNMLDDQSPNYIIRMGAIDPRFNEYVSYSNRLPNPNLKWEQTNSFSWGLDGSYLNRRLNVGLSFYKKHTRDAFTTVNVSSVNGVDNYVMNGGSIRNTGYSVSVSGTPIRNEDWTLTLSTYYGGNFNKVESGADEAYTINNYLTGTAIVDGEPLGTFYSYKYMGLSPLNGIPIMDDYADRQHLIRGKSLEETVKIVMENSGSREPIFNGSLSAHLSYKQFSLSTMFSYSIGGKMRLFNLYAPIISGVNAQNNVRKDFINRWRVEGDEKYTDVPAIISPADPDFVEAITHYAALPTSGTKIQNFATSTWNMYDLSNLRVVSSDYFKFTSISVRYGIDKKYLTNTPFSSMAISFNTQDLFTIASKELKGQDPFQAGFATPNLSLRPSYTVQLNVSF